MNRNHREQQIFDRVYRNIPKDREDLIITEEEINRYQYPSPLPIYGRVFSFYLLGDVTGKKVLDYGCGDGDNAIFLAKKGAEVVAIDISYEAVSLTKTKAKINNVEDKVKVIQMNGEKMSFTNGEFDCVLGDLVLHHLNPDRAVDEIYRILKDGGIAVFREAVIFGRALRIIRKIIPYRHSITPDERPLSDVDIRSFGERFSKIEWWPFEAISRIQFLFKNRHILKFLFKADYSLFKTFPFMRKFASCAVIRCIK